MAIQYTKCAWNIPNDRKIFNILHSKALHNVPKLGFWVLKYRYRLATRMWRIPRLFSPEYYLILLGTGRWDKVPCRQICSILYARHTYIGIIIIISLLVSDTTEPTTPPIIYLPKYQFMRSLPMFKKYTLLFSGLEVCIAPIRKFFYETLHNLALTTDNVIYKILWKIFGQN
jgi:hypothetical protein